VITHKGYCPGPGSGRGCATNELVELGKRCSACEAVSDAVANEHRREAERLRAAGFALEIEMNGRALWRHPVAGDSLWHDEALASLDTAEAEAQALEDNRDPPPAA
jgi:hypothetical protein